MHYTVLLALPDDIANEQCCAADTVTRLFVTAETVEDAIEVAAKLAAAETANYSAELFAPIAVYEGRQFDLFQP